MMSSRANNRSAKVLVLFGPPGSGKDTHWSAHMRELR